MLHGLGVGASVGFLSRGPLGGWRGHSGGVSGTLGHSTVSTTLNIYTTARERGKESAMGAVERALRAHAPADVLPIRRDGTQG